MKAAIIGLLYLCKILLQVLCVLIVFIFFTDISIINLIIPLIILIILFASIIRIAIFEVELIDSIETLIGIFSRLLSFCSLVIAVAAILLS